MRLRITNPNNNVLVLDDRARGMYCVGKAVLQGTVVQPSGSDTDGAPGKLCGYSVYRIWHPYPVIFAFDLPEGRSVSIISVTQPAAGVWDVKMYCGGGSAANQFEATQYQVDVWAFGRLTGLSAGSKQYIKDASGGIAYDFLASGILFPRAAVTLNYVSGGFSPNVTIPALSRPVALGNPTSYSVTSELVGTKRYADVWRFNALARTGTSLREVQVAKQRYEYNGADPQQSGDVFTAPSPIFILEGSLLP